MAHTFTPTSSSPRAGRLNLDSSAAIEARVELAACLQLAALHGLEEGICNHFSAMVPGHDGLFFVNPYGYAFDEITASDLLVCDFAGNVIEGHGLPEATAFYIHAQLHLRQPRIKAAFHTHMPNATALCLLQGPPLLWLGQTALKFYGRTAVDEHYNGLALDNLEGQRIAAALGNADILFLKNHGVMVAAPNIAQAWDDLYYLERAAQVQLKAMASGQPLKPIDSAVAQRAYEQMREGDPASARAHLDSGMRRLKQRGSRFDQ
ncbi:aldolase [Pseudomonas sp. R5-89-07]|uniref:aldolase n=1 Tax=Pseudomonas sp. R5-89-07 TaxID=658644 RepID=UPI000F584D5A|nr:aldolase [Pseudomonas sp. R5-89-07]AZF05449.1 Ribulose-5-phosphate 4-epimerase, putative [Pseudomonas sp. R5-89-07]